MHRGLCHTAPFSKQMMNLGIASSSLCSLPCFAFAPVATLLTMRTLCNLHIVCLGAVKHHGKESQLRQNALKLSLAFVSLSLYITLIKLDHLHDTLQCKIASYFFLFETTYYFNSQVAFELSV